jgi:hypothetical protein
VPALLSNIAFMIYAMGSRLRLTFVWLKVSYLISVLQPLLKYKEIIIIPTNKIPKRIKWYHIHKGTGKYNYITDAQKHCVLCVFIYVHFLSSPLYNKLLESRSCLLVPKELGSHMLAKYFLNELAGQAQFTQHWPLHEGSWGNGFERNRLFFTPKFGSGGIMGS